MFGLGFQEVIVLGVVAVLLFGKRLPDVARSLGSSYRDFRRGLTDLQSQMDFRDTIYSAPRGRSSASSTSSYAYGEDDRDETDQPTAPKFELPGPHDSPSDAASNSVNS